MNKGQIMNKLLIQHKPENKDNIPPTKNSMIQTTAPKEINQLPADMVTTMEFKNTDEKPSINVFTRKKSDNISKKDVKTSSKLQGDPISKAIKFECVPCQKVFSDQIMYLKHEWAHKKTRLTKIFVFHVLNQIVSKFSPI